MIDAAPLISIISSLETRLSTTNRRLVAKWSKNGISIYDADVYCIKLGYHPYEIFGEEYFSGLEDEIEQYKKLYGDNADV